jgi:protein O-mannosyl-transferase
MNYKESKIWVENVIASKKIILIFLVIVLYSNTLRNEFALDDTMMITENKFTKGGFEGLKKIFTTDAFSGYLGEGKTLLPGGRYRPLSQAIFNIYHSIFGLKPFGLHLINVLIFLITAVLVFKNLRDLLGSDRKKLFSVAFIASLLYVSHPIHTEVVANIKSLDLLLSMLFSMVSLHYSISYYRTGKHKYLLGLGLSFFLGILSKETSLTFFAIIPLAMYYFSDFNIKKLVISQSVLSLVVAIYFLMRWNAIGETLNVEVFELLNDPFLGTTIAQKYATIFYTWFIYIKLLIIPYPLTHDYYPYAIEIKSWANIMVILSFILHFSALIYSVLDIFKAFKNKVKPGLISFGILFYLIIFTISSNLIIGIGTFMNERFIFIADIGIFIIIGHFIINYINKKPEKAKIVTNAIIGVIIIFSVLTITRNTAWKDDFTLFRTDVEVSENSAKCTVSAGGKSYEAALKEKNIKQRNNLLIEAQRWVNKGVSIHPKYFQGWLLLGNIKYELGKFDEALISYNNCLAISSRNNDVLNNMHNLVIKSREANDLITSNAAIKVLLTNNYQITKIKFLQAINLEKASKIDSSLLVLNEIIKLDTSYADAYNKLGQMTGQYKGDMVKAEELLLKSYELKRTNPSTLENLGTLYAITGDLNKALYYFKESWKSDQNNQQIYKNIINAYMNLGNIDEAKKWENEAVKKFGQLK